MIHACEYTAPKTQPTQVSSTKLPFYHGTPNPPSSSCTQMHIPPQLLTPLCSSGYLNLLSACPFMLWHNVACYGWPPLVQVHTLLTVNPPCMWCNIGVFSGSTGGGKGLYGIVFFPSPLLLFLFGRVTRQKKSLCTLFSPAKVWPIWKQPWREEDKRTHMWHAKAFRDLGQDSELVLEARVSLVNASDRLQPLAILPYPLKITHTCKQMRQKENTVSSAVLWLKMSN